MYILRSIIARNLFSHARVLEVNPDQDKARLIDQDLISVGGRGGDLLIEVGSHVDGNSLLMSVVPWQGLTTGRIEVAPRQEQLATLVDNISRLAGVNDEVLHIESVYSNSPWSRIGSISPNSEQTPLVQETANQVFRHWQLDSELRIGQVETNAHSTGLHSFTALATSQRVVDKVVARVGFVLEIELDQKRVVQGVPLTAVRSKGEHIAVNINY